MEQAHFSDLRKGQKYFEILLTRSKPISRTKEMAYKNGKRKIQGGPQSQTAAFPRHQEEEKIDKTKQAQIEQTYEKH